MINLRKEDLPDKENFKNNLKIIAALDVVFSPDWEDRYFSYDKNWSKNEEMASMRDGEGSEYYIIFKGDDIFGKIFDGENNHKKLNFPKKVEEFIKEPAFSIEYCTVLFWNISGKWNSSGNKFLLMSDIFLSIEKYIGWIEEYYEIKVDGDTITEIIKSNTITEIHIKKLNNNITWKSIKDEIHGILDN